MIHIHSVYDSWAKNALRSRKADLTVYYRPFRARLAALEIFYPADLLSAIYHWGPRP